MNLKYYNSYTFIGNPQRSNIAKICQPGFEELTLNINNLGNKTMLAYAISKLNYSQHRLVIQPLPYYDNILIEHNSLQNTLTQTLNNKTRGLCSSPPDSYPL